MPNLSQSLLHLSSLLGSLSGLTEVRDHLFKASREVLLAVQGLLDMADQYVQDVSGTTDKQASLQGIIQYAQKLIKTVTKQLPQNDAEGFRVIHRNVVSSILEVIEGEMKKAGRSHHPKAKMKLEVFEAVRKVLLKEMYEQEKGSPSHEQ